MLVDFDNGSDIIDSRDIIERLADLAGRWAAHATDPTEPALDDDEADEMRALTALVAEAEDYIPDWQYGEALIRDSYFEEYAEQLAEDIGAIDRQASWPLSYIDWGRAADALKQDYMALDYDGATYWARA